MDLYTRLKSSQKPIVLYGMGNGADKIIDILEAKGITVSGVFASDGFVRRKLFRGMPLMSYSEAKAHFGSMIVLVSFGTSLSDVLDNIKRIAYEQELYVPDVPVFGDGLFDVDFAKAHKDELERVYNALATDKDRAVYETLVRYKIHGNPEGLYRTAGDEDALYCLLSPKSGEVYVDCGAFIGDTIAAYLRHASDYKRIYAIEPDGRSFKKLSAYLASLERAEGINAPLSDKVESARFVKCGSRGSHISDEGEEVRTLSLDSLFADCGADYVKIDVEGAEAAVIEGARQLISVHRPKLLLSCYHRAEDIFALPLQVLAIRPDYKIHLWHPMYLPPWDASFIFV